MPKPHDSVRVFQEHIYGDQRRKKGSKIWSKFERAPSRNLECFLASPVVKILGNSQNIFETISCKLDVDYFLEFCRKHDSRFSRYSDIFTK